MFVFSGGAVLAQDTIHPKFADLDPDEARKLIAENEGNERFVLLDTRTLAEHEKDHLAGAVFMNYSADDFWDRVRELDRAKVYLVYCHNGGRSGKTVEYMRENGFAEAHNLAGGILAWKRAGYAVLRE